MTDLFPEHREKKDQEKQSDTVPICAVLSQKALLQNPLSVIINESFFTLGEGKFSDRVRKVKCFPARIKTSESLK